ncbi:MAG: hypothetical protein U0670_14285 [Anaerolineae bacterium]
MPAYLRWQESQMLYYRLEQSRTWNELNPSIDKAIELVRVEGDREIGTLLDVAGIDQIPSSAIQHGIDMVKRKPANANYIVVLGAPLGVRKQEGERISEYPVDAAHIAVALATRVCFDTGLLSDPDSVEVKNVGRQMFLKAEIGQPIAHVLIGCFNTAIGLETVAIAAPVDAECNFDSHSGGLVIGYVDNHEARIELSRVRNAVWIDCGNHFASGQVMIGNTGDRALMMQHLDGRDGKYAYLPNAALLFPQLLQPETSPAPEPPRS